MNNKEYIAELARRTGATQADAQVYVKTLIDAMTHTFEAGDSVSISAFGSFEVKKRLERIVVNPATGARMLVPPKLVLNFRPV